MENYCLNEFFNNCSEYIRIYITTETIQDPYEKNVEFTELNPLPVKAIVTDLIASQIIWKMPGIETNKAKEIIIKKKHRNLLEKSYRISIKENNTWVDFEGWKINAKMQLREEGDFIRCYVYAKKT